MSRLTSQKNDDPKQEKKELPETGIGATLTLVLIIALILGVGGSLIQDYWPF